MCAVYKSKSMLLLESIYVVVCFGRFIRREKTGFLNLLPSRRPTLSVDMLTIHHVFSPKEETKEAKWEGNKAARREARKRSKQSIDGSRIGCDSKSRGRDERTISQGWITSAVKASPSSKAERRQSASPYNSVGKISKKKMELHHL